jgi:hypothetical protein
MLTAADRDAIPDDWTLWSVDDSRLILAYRPDIFDGSDTDPACMPMIYLSRGRRSKRPEGNRNLPPDAPWVIRLHLEPDVTASPRYVEDRADAVSECISLTRAFIDGEIDYRALYQVPRERYLDRLDEQLAASARQD